MNALWREIRSSAAGDIERTGPDTVVRRYRFSPGFIGFSGHFPGNPILPAIVQVCAVVSLAEEDGGKALRLEAVRSAKFLSPIRPGEEVSILCRRRGDSGEEICDATLTVAGKTSAAFQLRWTEEEVPR
jgi:3-hydroxyacyl-[acyl-carrier-protein] dehydratase